MGNKDTSVWDDYNKAMEDSDKLLAEFNKGNEEPSNSKKFFRFLYKALVFIILLPFKIIWWIIKIIFYSLLFGWLFNKITKKL